MSRVARESLDTTFFHVLVQGINKSYIFEQQEDILYYIKQMYELKANVGIDIIAYCIMNNHAHLLLNVENTKRLSEYMHKLNTRYAVYYNKIHDRVGYVFRDRFKSQGIYSEQQLYRCIKYIYDNPVKAKICEKPWEYKYSNYKKCEYINQTFDDNENFIDIDIADKIIEKENKYQQVKNMIDNFLKENFISKAELKYNKELLSKLVITVREKANVSIRWLENELGVSRETIRKLIK